MSAVFVSNPGGSSKKYALYVSGLPVLEAVFECVEDDYQVTTKDEQKKETIKSISQHDYADSLEEFLGAAQAYVRSRKEIISSAGIRVLAAGSDFQSHQVIDDVFVSKLRAKEPTAPLHIPTTLQEIQQCKALLPGVPLLAVSDTALFASLPPVAREYSLPRKDAKTYDIHRFGYHGLSVASVRNRVHAVIGRDPDRMVVCHIGSGISVTGLAAGQPVYTSAGYASCTSLPMLTRGGDIDAGALFELLRLHRSKHQEVNTLVHHRCGLKALSGTDDMRLVLDRKAQGDNDAVFALAHISFEIQKAIAAASVATGGIEAIIFTGTIGLRSPEFRRLVISGLTHFGCGLDTDKNNLFLGREGVISDARSLVKVAAMRTDEMGEIAHIAAAHTEKRRV